MKALRNSLLACAGLGAVVVLVDLLLPQRIQAANPEEVELLKHRDTCQILFVGPSYVRSQVKPSIFDEEAKRIGLNKRACKYGRKGLRGFELRSDIQRLLNYKWKKLELVVVDITIGQAIGFESGNWFKSRMLEWHTWEAIPWLASYYRRDPRSWREKLPEIASHLEHVAAHYLLIGRGTDLLLAQANAGSGGDDADDEEPGEAAVAVPTPEPPSAAPAASTPTPREVRAGRQAQTRAYARTLWRLRRIRSKRARDPKYIPSGWALELRELVRAYGYEAYFLYAPVLHTVLLPERTVVGDDRLVVLDFTDLDRYPELYRESVRRGNHIQGQAVIDYSTYLAQAINEHLKPTRVR